MKIAIILPAFNEEATVTNTIRDFHVALPHADIYVIDNNSQDKTAELARTLLKEYKNNSQVIFEKKQGKGNAVKSAFSKINADIYVLVDADSTYPACQVNVIANTTADEVHHKLFLKAVVVVFKFNFFFKTS